MANMNREEAVGLAMHMLGATKAFRFSRTSSQVYELLAIKAVKEHKAYETLGHTWESFCKQILGSSRSKIDEDLQNLRALGERFMELADDLALSRGALRSLRSLSSDVRPKVLDSGELEIGDQRVPLDPDHRDEIEEVLEGLLANQEQMAAQLEAGEEQLRNLDEKNTELDKQVKSLEGKDRDDFNEKFGISDLDHAFARLWALTKEICRVVDEEQPEPERILKWVRRIDPQFSELTRYGGQLADVELPEDWDPEMMEEIAREDPDILTDE